METNLCAGMNKAKNMDLLPVVEIFRCVFFFQRHLAFSQTLRRETHSIVELGFIALIEEHTVV